MKTTAAPLFDVTVMRSGREEHVLRLNEDEHARQDDAAGEPTGTVTRKLTGLVGLHLAGLDLDHRSVTITETTYTPEARRRERRERFISYVRQAEELGIDVVNLLSELLLAERHVRDFEQRTGRPLDVRRFPPIWDRSVLLTPEDWGALDVLDEIIRNVPRALSCERVRSTLKWLRVERGLRAERDLPPALKPLLRRIGDAIAKPTKAGALKRKARRSAILKVWNARASLDPDARQREAERLDLANWETLSRMARRYRRG